MRIGQCLLTAVGACLVALAPTPLRAADDEKPNYRAAVHTKDGDKELRFDLTKQKDADQLMDHLKRGEVHQLKQDKPPDLLGLQWDLGLWSVIVFLGLFIILSKFAWPKMLEGLQRREANIRGAFVEAEKARAEADKMRAQFQAEMAKASEKVGEMLEEARRDSQATKDQMVAEARQEIQSERDRLHRELKTARDQAVQELWNQTAQLATLISTKALRRQMTVDDHSRLLDEALSEFQRGASEHQRRTAGLHSS